MKHFKHIISVAAIAFLVYIFTFYIDGEMGVILFAFLILAPLTSLFFTVYARKRIRLTFDCDGYVPKGGKLALNVTVEKTGFFPFAVVEIKPFASEVFIAPQRSYRLSMLNSSHESFTLELESSIGGNGSVGIEAVYSCGFLGFLRLRVKDGLPPLASVGVIPDIPDVKTSSQLYRAVADSVVTSDEEEENDSAVLFSSNTTPGYEHREYVQGDPLKRINWKLSSKKDKLMVRLDEAVSSVQPLLILDLYRNSDIEPRISACSEEQILRSVFGLLSALVKHGIACRLAYRTAVGEVICEGVESPEYPAQLMLKILSVKVNAGERIDISRVEDSLCACIIATTDAKKDFSEITDRLASMDNVSLIGASPDTQNSTELPLWYLAEDNNFKMV